MAKKRLYRDSNRVIGGVCSGIADCLDAPLLAVRIVSVLLVFVTCGLAMIAYLVLWLVLPESSSKSGDYIDVTPLNTEESGGAPKPPASITGSINAVAYSKASKGGTGNLVCLAEDPVRGAPGAAYTSSSATAQDVGSEGAVSKAGAKLTTNERVVVTVALVLIVLGTLLIVNHFVVHIAVWRFWPLCLVAAGLVFMLIPSERGWTLRGFFMGVALLALGVALALLTMGFVPRYVYGLTLRALWPVLLLVFGLVVLDLVLNKQALSAVATLVFLVALFGGLAYYGSQDPAALYIKAQQENQLKEGTPSIFLDENPFNGATLWK